MMTTDPLIALLSNLGVAAPLVALLWLLLRQATEERRQITDRFLGALETTVSGATKATHENTAATHDLASAIEANRHTSADEHARIVDALGKMNRREP